MRGLAAGQGLFEQGNLPAGETMLVRISRVGP